MSLEAVETAAPCIVCKQSCLDNTCFIWVRPSSGDSAGVSDYVLCPQCVLSKDCATCGWSLTFDSARLDRPFVMLSLEVCEHLKLSLVTPSCVSTIPAWKPLQELSVHFR